MQLCKRCKVSKCSLLNDLSLFTYCHIIRFNPAYLLISAERGGEPAQPPIRGFRSEFKTIQLAGRTQGVFYNGCGASCTALVEWQYQGVLYRVTMKNGREETLVQIANSAIEAGPR